MDRTLEKVSRAPSHDNDDERLRETLRVTEMYKSVQGESTWAGLPCVFIRLTGCNLRCVWCDTAYAFQGGTETAIGEILGKCEELGCSLVEITGGEPLVQENCPTLAACLLEQGMTVLCETGGSLPITVLPDKVIRIMDLKCPGSGECDKNDWSNIDALTPRDEVKFVIADRADYEWSRDVVEEYDLPARCNQVLFAPVFGAIGPRQLVKWILEDGLEVRFQLQLHKLIFPPDQRGV